MKKYIAVFMLLFSSITFGGDGRTIEFSINDSWIFYKDSGDKPIALREIGDREVEIVNLPHTWNAEDAIHGATSKEEGYYRGPAWYLRKITVPAHYQDKELYVFFEGANQETDVFVNGQFAGGHVGGYTRFVVPISKFVQFDSSKQSADFELAVRVDNVHNLDIPPLSADFTFYGGIYRDVFLVATEKVHFNIEDHASNGIYIRTPSVSAEQVEMDVDVQLINCGTTDRNVKLETIIYDPYSKPVVTNASDITLAAGQKLTAKPKVDPIHNPSLWSPDSPNLYRLVCRLYDAETNQMLDESMSPFGCRWFSFDAEKGFFLNGKHLKLIGTNRHQDYLNIGNALPDYIHREDIKKMKEMGSNFLRIAHYPQDPAVLELCDRLGILTTVEVPIIDTITESEAFKQNCLNIHLEMMRQNYNHPSLIIWAYMNEVLLHPKYQKDKEKQKDYFEKVYEIASELEALTRKEDPYRYTMIPNHANLNLYKDTKLTDLPMIVGWNIYFGWYKGEFSDIKSIMTEYHHTIPDKPMIIAEYGAGADPRLHALTPTRFDFTIEYATRFHEQYLSALTDFPFISGINVWNFADFGSVGRVDTVPNINNKGLIGIDRKPKDAYFFYQAALLKKPFIGITAKTWIRRACVESKSGKGVCMMPVEIFSNQNKLELFHNGISLGAKMVQEHNKVIWDVPFVDGNNILRAVSSDNSRVEDCATVRMDVLPIKLDDFPVAGLSINCGDYRFFYDDILDRAWLPEKVYIEGSWGYIGGKVYAMEQTPRQSFGTSQPIEGTNCDPLYQTQRIGIKQYRFDVPPGVYEVTLHLAELTGKMAASLPYSLDGFDDKKPSITKNREFTVNLNGTPVIERISLAKDYGSFRAVKIKAIVTTEADEPLLIDFVPLNEDAVINGIELNKKL
ncbi:glycoside hydrolase family 2 TIM barrel-domain containing protein [Bythopirellula polymerisocia]|uniref:Beta-galactosidase n=1 Tax=Bythopirellula polymerisocia TaxID=2528003 RepID=A0A5C6CUM3_9BACT|nr:glycoside hydrolase family 2 TIM barrel-domain containing protein [Bythopirellula polymerisocia]TWU28673.1 Beta-galactosidase [Bythopirellula polymerisocia]